ncbi:PLP-dependent transferase [Fomitiporia mediterranea MF3/22]|uniref:PLP-dependent transferase n=1 Tax=Fomitiporia mediterranea (strain MF3/22) TaxID=694068 RepID=UPI000440751D|nr:PLP-dependent transferase [Fomitiporia mediterranea MF3/22]EJC99775.1 PLP-dependent transferase [Fomitiporia mediterranea MF3/22]
MDSPLDNALRQALDGRMDRGTPLFDLAKSTPTAAPDLFSNDYLSITSDPELSRSFLEKLAQESATLGAGGSRLLGGNPLAHVQFELRMKEIFSTEAALLFNSGYDANTAFFSSLPQAGDAIIFDELVHASARDGMSVSRAKDALYPFSHNSVLSLKQTLCVVLQQHPNIAQGKGTAFFAVESLYSMDGDLAPLPEMLNSIDELIPKNCSHIVVDEAHGTGLYGEGGRGIVSMLGLGHRVHSVLHTFGKARGFSGAVLLTSVLVKSYITNYARPFIYTTALPRTHIAALNASFDYVMNQKGQDRRDRLQELCRFFESHLREAVKMVDAKFISLPPRNVPEGYPEGIRTPIFPILTPMPLSLAKHIQSLGYACYAIPHPAVPKGQERIRVIVHAENTESELVDFIKQLLDWVAVQRQAQIDGKSLNIHLARL